ncbi:MAG TPA: hypothetical protein VKB19_15305 [Pedobacter sp.]|nr:hypothetical protein [Pedobacter sp.]
MKNRNPTTAPVKSKREPGDLPVQPNPADDVNSTPRKERNGEDEQKWKSTEKNNRRKEWPSVSWP